MYRAVRSAARQCRHAAATAAARRVAAGAGARLSHGPAAWQQLLRQRPRQALAGTRDYIGVPVSAIATPFPQSAPGVGVAPGGAAARPWATPAPAAAPADSTLQRLWQAYLQSLARQPLLTKAATSFVCVVIGDSIAQAVGGAPYSLLRVLRLAAYSSTVGATTGHYWHRWLEQHVHPESPTCGSAITKKMLLDQMLLSPIMTAVFFAALKVMEGRPDAIVPFLQEKYVQTVLAGASLWVPYNLCAFKWIPQDLRILAGNLVGIGWGTFMSISCINQPAAAVAAAAVATEAAAVLQAEL